MSKYYIFLDIDGVFTSNRVNFACKSEYELWHKFDPIAIEFMNSLHDKYDVEFVLISTWKNHLNAKNSMIFHWISSAFGNAGFRGKFSEEWKTNAANENTINRAHEIKDFIYEHGIPLENIVIFDDNDYNFKSVLGKSRLVRTDADNGLLYKHMLNALSLMGNWDKK